MKANKIICDNCHCKLDKESIVIKSKEAKIAGSKINMRDFNCNMSNKTYLITVENYTIHKKKRKYDLIMRSINRKRKYGIKVSEQRLKEVTALKDDLISYEMKLKDKYKNLIPREILD